MGGSDSIRGHPYRKDKGLQNVETSCIARSRAVYSSCRRPITRSLCNVWVPPHLCSPPPGITLHIDLDCFFCVLSFSSRSSPPNHVTLSRPASTPLISSHLAWPRLHSFPSGKAGSLGRAAETLRLPRGDRHAGPDALRVRHPEGRASDAPAQVDEKTREDRPGDSREGREAQENPGAVVACVRSPPRSS